MTMSPSNVVSSHPPGDAARLKIRNLWEWLGVTLLFTLLTLWYTNPLWRHAGTFLVDDGDPLGNVCIQWWLSRQFLSGHLSGLWSLPPYFYPAWPSITFNDPQIGATVLGLPFFAATGNAVLAYNAVVLLSFPLCALGTYALTRHLTGSRSAGVFAGVAWGFGLWRLGHVAHQQLLSLEFLPFLLLVLHRYGETRAPRYLVGIFTCWLAQEYLAEYWGMFLILLIVPFALLLLRVTSQLTWRETGRAFLAIGLAVVAWIPLQIPYLIASKHGIHHPVSEIMRLGADLSDYLPPPGMWLWGGWSGMLPDHRNNSEFWVSPGLIVLTLALITGASLWRYQRRPVSSEEQSDRRIHAMSLSFAVAGLGIALLWAWMRRAGTTALMPIPDLFIDRGSLVCLCVICFLIAPALHLRKRHRILARDVRSPMLPYFALAALAVLWSCGYDIRLDGFLLAPGIHRLMVVLPGTKSFRVVARIGVFADLALIVLASAWVVSALRRLPQRNGPWLRVVSVAALCLLVLAESLPRTGMAFWSSHDRDWRPAARQADRWLAAQPPAPMLELPLTNDHYFETVRMWHQLTHHQPMRNGQGTFTPLDYAQDMRTLTRPQSAESVLRLRKLGVRYVLLDVDRRDQQRSGSLIPSMPLSLPPPFRLLFADEEVKVYEVA